MAIDLTRKVVFKVTADTKDADRSFKGMKGGIEDVTKQARSLGIEIEDTRSHWQRFVDSGQAGAAAVGDHIKRMASGFTNAANGINDFVGKLGPYNQVLELGGKAAKFIGDAMDGAAKRHPEYADSYKKLTDEVNRYKTAAMDAVGIAAIETLKPIPSLEKLAEAYETVENRVMRVFKAYDSPEAHKARGNAALFNFLSGETLRAALPGSDPWSTGPSVSELVQQGLAKMKADYEAQQKAAAAYQTQWSDLAGVTGMDNSRRVSNIKNFLTGDTASTSLGQAAGYEDSTRAYLDHLAHVQQMQERTSDWMAQLSSAGADAVAADLARLERFTEISGDAYETIVTGSASATQAFRAMAQQQMLTYGKREVAEAISQTALGFGALANPLFAGAAAMHFKSAATHAAAAAAFGVGTAIAGSVGAGGGGSSGASSSGGSSGGGRSGGSSSTTTTTVQNYYIVAGSDHAEDSPRIRQSKAKRLVDLATTKTSVGGSF